ncbi:MAG TPA: hypothetical protein VIL38_01315 [Thermaerobacter sp.]
MSETDLWELVVETRKDLDRWIERGRRAQAAAGRGDWETARAELEARRFLQEQVSARLQRLQRGAGEGGHGLPGGPAARQWLAQLEDHLRRALEADRQLRLALAVRHEALGERARFLEQARRAVAAYARHGQPDTPRRPVPSSPPPGEGGAGAGTRGGTRNGAGGGAGGS